MRVCLFPYIPVKTLLNIINIWDDIQADCLIFRGIYLLSFMMIIIIIITGKSQ